MTYYLTQVGREFIDEAKRTSLFKKGPSTLDPTKSASLPTRHRIMPGGHALSYDRAQYQGRQEGGTDDAKSDRRITARGLTADRTSANPVRSQSPRPGDETMRQMTTLKPGSLKGDRINRRDRTNRFNAGRAWGLPRGN